MTRARKAWLRFLATRVVGLAADAAILALAYLSATALRFDFRTPSWGWRATASSFATVCAVHLTALVACGCYRLAWRRIRGSELPRYLGAMALSCVVLLALRAALPSVAMAGVRPAYSIAVISFFLGSAGILGARLLWRVYWTSRVRDDALLARDETHSDDAVARAFLAGRTVLVTGAGGSIGAEIVRQTAAAGAVRILMVERGENALYEIDRRMQASGLPAAFVPLMIDVNDHDRMDAVFARERPSVVLHAAAYKHVTMVEMNPEEGWRNNTGATRRLAALALAHGVARFVLISTDKAVNPVSVLGRTKRAAEEAVLALNAAPAGDAGAAMRFCAVRFGNVTDSAGSVIPLFRAFIERRRPVPVTHPDMTRSFMTAREAVSLILRVAARKEGAIYTLDMGEPVRILDLAEALIAQAGYRPYVDIPIVFTGIRPGEKLVEETGLSARACIRTDMAKICITT